MDQCLTLICPGSSYYSMNISPFHVWAIVRFLPDMQRVVVNRFRRRSDAEECLRVLRRAAADRDYTLLYYPPGEESTFMVRKEYNKLVRDRIPEILESQQVKFGIEEMTQADYCQALRCKLIEGNPSGGGYGVRDTQENKVPIADFLSGALLRECTLQRSTHPVLYLEARPLVRFRHR